MGEKRKKHFTILLTNESKKNHKIELFKSTEWPGVDGCRPGGCNSSNRYRLRVDGKWYSYDGHKYTFLTRYEIRDLIWRSTKEQF